MVRHITLKTGHLHLMTKEKVAEEIRAQGVEKILDHIKWSSYICCCFQEKTGRVVEFFKHGKDYKSRDTEDFFNPVDESFAISKIRGALVRV